MRIILPPVNRRVVTPVIPVTPWWGGSFEFSLFSSLSFGFKNPVSTVYFTLTFISVTIRCQAVFSFPSFPNFTLLK